MRCTECAQEFGTFDQMIPIFQLQLVGGGVEPSGYAHAWHFKPVGDRD